MNDKMLQRYLETSVYTDVGAYRDFVLSLPDDIASIGMCGWTARDLRRTGM